MGAVTEGLVYSLCDALGMNLDVDPKSLAVSGSMTRKVKIGQIEMDIPLKVVASQVDPKGYLLVLRSKGNLALLVTAKQAKAFDAMTLDLLNVAKMGNPGGVLSGFTTAITPDAAREFVRTAIVKSFKKVSRNEWAEA